MIQPYAKSQQIVTCPSSKPNASYAGDLSYFANGMYFIRANGSARETRALSSLVVPAQTVVLYDDTNGERRDQIIFRLYVQSNTNVWVAGSAFSTIKNGVHNETHNVLFADGHVKAVKYDRLKDAVSCRADGVTIDPATGAVISSSCS